MILAMIVDLKATRADRTLAYSVAELQNLLAAQEMPPAIASLQVRILLRFSLGAACYQAIGLHP